MQILKYLMLASNAFICFVVLESSISYSKTFNSGILVAHDRPPINTNNGSSMSTEEINSHHHKKIDIPDGQTIPSVNLIVHSDKIKGWNLELQLNNFRFAPERVNTNSITTEGHAHLYIDDQKITRLYSSWYYLSHLEPGQHKITVTLNANGHEELVHNGKPISGTVIVEVPATN